MTPRAQRSVFALAVFALWLLFFVQALSSSILLDDWFQIKYWRDHDFGVAALWQLAHHNYFHYNPRLGDLLLAIVDGSRAIHLVATPLVQLAIPPLSFAIAFARWPRATLRDTQQLVVLQALIWLVIPFPGVLYFYRPLTTNYVWAFAITQAWIVPYRFAVARPDARARWWLAPIMLVVGWLAGMCNEHTGPTAFVVGACLVYVAWRRGAVRPWMIAGLVGLGLGYAMLFFAPGQRERYAGLATRATPLQLIADRGISGCFEIVRGFLWEARLGFSLFIAVVAGALVAARTRRIRLAVPRPSLIAIAALLAAATAVVATLFASPIASDRMLYAPGVLVAIALAIGVDALATATVVRRVALVACLVLSGYTAARFVESSSRLRAENDDRLARLAATPPGTVAMIPMYSHPNRSRWEYGDDFVGARWLRDYVGGTLYDLAGVSLTSNAAAGPKPELVETRIEALDGASQDEPGGAPTYRQLQSSGHVAALARLAATWGAFQIRDVGSLAKFDKRPVLVALWAPPHSMFVDGAPHDDVTGHYIRVASATLPDDVVESFVVGCGERYAVSPVRRDDFLLLPVDERYCRGPFTALVCEPARCWVAGWY
jgi:hypothetical protein